MNNKWRLPSIMELSIFLETHTWESLGPVWSNTKVTNSKRHGWDKMASYYWISSWDHSKNRVIQESRPHSQKLVSIFVKTNLNELQWSHTFRSITFVRAQVMCSSLSKHTQVAFRSLRADVCYA